MFRVSYVTYSLVPARSAGPALVALLFARACVYSLLNVLGYNYRVRSVWYYARLEIIDLGTGYSNVKIRRDRAVYILPFLSRKPMSYESFCVPSNNTDVVEHQFVLQVPTVKPPKMWMLV